MSEVTLSTSWFNRLHHGLIFLTLVLGTYFTKFHVAGPLYLHDVLLLAVVLLSVLRLKTTYAFPPVLLMLGISMVYLIISLALRSTPASLTFRQYAIFGYCLLYYLLFNKTYSKVGLDSHIRFLYVVGLLAALLQLGYVVNLVLNGNSPFEDYNYFSPAVVTGLCVGAAAWLSADRSWLMRGAGFVFVLFLSTTTGHSSSFLAVFTVGVAFLFLRVNQRSKVIMLSAGLTAILVLWWLLPQFQDANASWRIITWGHFLHQAIVENYGLIGNGFGVPFFDNDLVQELYSRLGSMGFFDPSRPNDIYLSTGHNFFLTLAFTIGFIPALLIFAPFVSAFRYFLSPGQSSREGEFLLLSLVGASMWAAFNVIVELPHSAGLFWLIYFTAMGYFEWAASSRNIPASQNELSAPTTRSMSSGL